MTTKTEKRLSRIQRAFNIGKGMKKEHLPEEQKNRLLKLINRMYEYQEMPNGVNPTRRFNYNHYGRDGRTLEEWIEDVERYLDQEMDNISDQTSDIKQDDQIDTKQIRRRKNETVVWIRKDTYGKIQKLAEKYGQRVTVFTNGSLEWLAEVAENHIEEIFQKIIGMGKR